MAIDGALEDGTSGETLYVGADGLVELTVYADADKTTIQDVTGWTVVLDIRRKDTATTALLSKTGTVSGSFNSTPGSNTQKVSFTLSDDDLAASTFTGDDFEGRYSIWRTDAGYEQPLRYGDCVVKRLTRT